MVTPLNLISVVGPPSQTNSRLGATSPDGSAVPRDVETSATVQAVPDKRNIANTEHTNPENRMR
jgi:hypothetical protein